MSVTQIVIILAVFIVMQVAAFAAFYIMIVSGIRKRVEEQVIGEIENKTNSVVSNFNKNALQNIEMLEDLIKRSKQAAKELKESSTNNTLNNPADEVNSVEEEALAKTFAEEVDSAEEGAAADTNELNEVAEKAEILEGVFSAVKNGDAQMSPLATAGAVSEELSLIKKSGGRIKKGKQQAQAGLSLFDDSDFIPPPVDTDKEDLPKISYSEVSVETPLPDKKEEHNITASASVKDLQWEEVETAEEEAEAKNVEQKAILQPDISQVEEKGVALYEQDIAQTFDEEVANDRAQGMEDEKDEGVYKEPAELSSGLRMNFKLSNGGLSGGKANEIITAMYDEGKSLNEIAKELGMFTIEVELILAVSGRI